ncbi:MAG: TIM barrel protein [Hyphomicrobiaceae bacterium]|nr:TIM barrel protein [Hyphomicrobiaceae bacterium]MCC0023371.1 TIM barrel protein [Hyphomicrobiaceae bacterium]
MRGFSANLGLLYTSLPMAERMDAAARDGFRCVEFQFPYELDPRFIHDRLDELELQLLGINTDVDPGPAGHFGLAALPDRVEEARMLIDRAIELAHLAGGNAVHVMAGNTPANQPLARETFRSNLAYAAEAADTLGLTILIEPLNRADMPDYFFARALEAMDIIEELDTANLKLQFDAYHIVKMGDDPVALFPEMAHRVGHVQIAGSPDRTEPQNGAPDLAALFLVLKQCDYQGYIGLEYKPTCDPAETLREVQAIWDETAA